MYHSYHLNCVTSKKVYLDRIVDLKYIFNQIQLKDKRKYYNLINGFHSNLVFKEVEIKYYQMEEKRHKN